MRQLGKWSFMMAQIGMTCGNRYAMTRGKMNDKIKHIIAGAVIGLISALLIRHFWIKGAMILGSLLALLAGMAKELIWDKWLGKGTSEFADAWFTLWGGLFITIIMYFV